MIDTSVKVALVSGASRGIGEAIALRLVREGFFVVGTATSNEGAQRIEKKLENGLGVVLDVRSRDSTENLFLTLKEKNISPAVLVNLASTHYKKEEEHIAAPVLPANKSPKSIVSPSVAMVMNAIVLLAEYPPANIPLVLLL